MESILMVKKWNWFEMIVGHLSGTSQSKVEDL